MNFRLMLGATAILAVSTSPAWAHHKVYSPIVEEGVFEFETRGHSTFDRSRDKNDQQTHIYELEYGVNSWWSTAIFARPEKEPDGVFRYAATGFENIFQLTPQGKYWADVGLYVEYQKNHLAGGTDEFESKLLLEKAVDPLVVTANLVFNRQIGDGAGKGFGFEYAVRANYPWTRTVQFGIEAFGEPGRLTGFDAVREQQHLLGPVVLGKIDIPGLPGVLNYNIGYMFGLTPGTPEQTVKWEFEYEIPF